MVLIKNHYWNYSTGELYKSYTNQHQAKATLVCCDTPSSPLKVHGLILAANSEWFELVLNGQYDQEIPLPYKKNVIKHIINLIYNGVVDVESSIVPDIYKVAHGLKIRGLDFNNVNSHIKTKVQEEPQFTSSPDRSVISPVFDIPNTSSSVSRLVKNPFTASKAGLLKEGNDSDETTIDPNDEVLVIDNSGSSDIDVVMVDDGSPVAKSQITEKPKLNCTELSSPKIVEMESNNTKSPLKRNLVVEAKAGTSSSSNKWDTIDFSCTTKNAKGQTYNLKICSWDIGSLSSWVKKGCLEFLNYESPDIFCIQDTRCDGIKLPDEIKNLVGYKQYWCSGKKYRYAGVGLFTKLEPINVIYGIDNTEMDEEGRCITAEFNQYYLVCVYVPNAGRHLVRLPKRLKWNEIFKNFVNKLNSKKPVIICGDMNVSHNKRDLAKPQNNKRTPGFTQEERDGMTEFLGEGYIDTFRYLYPKALGAYTFWSYKANARSKNIGWRLDYFIISKRIIDHVCDSVIRSILGSDHCPIILFLNIEI